jgi:uncharacterized membrane protein
VEKLIQRKQDESAVKAVAFVAAFILLVFLDAYIIMRLVDSYRPGTLGYMQTLFSLYVFSALARYVKFS